ncbi:MAG: hypothetical protein AAB801_02655 [Patescibacteria group bacterium]
MIGSYFKIRIIRLFSNLLVFLLFAFFPILFNFWLINSQDEEINKRLFIEEEIEVVYPNLSDTTPRISEVMEPKTLHLKKDITLKKGDLVYFYDRKGVAVLVDGKTEDVLGIVSQRNL